MGKWEGKWRGEGLGIFGVDFDREIDRMMIVKEFGIKVYNVFENG